MNLSSETQAILEAAHEWMLVLEDPDVSPDERQRFAAWQSENPRHADVYDRVITYREAIKTLPKNAFNPDLHEPSATEVKRQRRHAVLSRIVRFGIPTALASAAAVLLAVAVLPRPEPAAPSITATPVSIATYDTDVGEIRTITLRDGSEITLGAASAVSVTLAAQRRSVTLDRGEAFFAVSSDPSRPFAVQAGQLTVTVVGTAFDVRRSAGVFRVAVAEGVVDVSQPFAIGDRTTDINDNKRLRKGETITATVHDGISAISAINPATVGNWRDGRLQYDGVSLAEVVADANRYSKIPIQLEPL
ncbi:MAG: FecR domain-containing protein, partial [Pseudomonadota bacterium]